MSGNIDLLISLRAAAHHPNKNTNIGHMTLYDGIFGKVLGGTDPDLVVQQSYMSSMPAMVKSVKTVMRSSSLRATVKVVTLTSTRKTDNEFLDLLLDDNIGVDCNPKCGVVTVAFVLLELNPCLCMMRENMSSSGIT